MNIYESFVFPDKLVSPINGYICKRITKQNIKQFGFSSIEELHSKFPEFPTKTTQYYNQSCNAMNKGRAILKLEKLNTIDIYNDSPNFCIECNCYLAYNKRNNQFCSASCSVKYYNKKQKPAQTKKNISNGLKNYHDSKPKYCKVFFPTCVECHNVFCSKTNIKFCSDKCRNEKHSKNGRIIAANNPRRSKDEIKLFELCLAEFESVEANLIIKDGWDADIVIDTLKIAILWNGPWHYTNMNIKGHSLLQVQNRDKIKKELFTRLGWKVLVYEDRNFTPESAFEDIKRIIGS